MNDTVGARQRTRVPWREWPDIVAAFGVMVGVEIGLRTVGLPRLARLMGTRLALDGDAATRQVQRGDLPEWAWRRLAASRRVVRHWPFGDTCLRVALVCGRRLRTLEPVLRVGVRKEDGELKAHAWLDVRGTSLDPWAAQDYAVMTPVAAR